MHQIGQTLRFIASADQKKFLVDLKTVYLNSYQAWAHDYSFQAASSVEAVHTIVNIIVPAWAFTLFTQ